MIVLANASGLSSPGQRAVVSGQRSGPTVAAPLPLGVEALDRWLLGGLARAALHEFYAEGAADIAAPRSLAATLAARAAAHARNGQQAGDRRSAGTADVLWLMQDATMAEIGGLDASGLALLGFDPVRLVLVRARSVAALLQATLEATRCPGLAAVVAEPWGEHKMLDLTASRRLVLAAQRSGALVLLARAGARPVPSAAETRWAVRAAASQPLLPQGPGLPAFRLSLLRHRRGREGGSWHLEWDPHEKVFRESEIRLAPHSRGSAAVPRDRPAATQPAEPVLRLAR